MIYNTLGIDNKKVITFLDNYTKLFKNLSMKKNYQGITYKSRLQHIQFEGVSRLFNNHSRHSVLDKRFTNLLPDK